METYQYALHKAPDEENADFTDQDTQHLDQTLSTRAALEQERHVLLSSENEEHLEIENQRRDDEGHFMIADRRFDHPLCLRILVGALGIIALIAGVMLGLIFAIFSVFASDSGQAQGFLQLGSFMIHTGVLIALDSIGFLYSCLQFVRNREGWKFIGRSMAGLAAYSVTSILVQILVNYIMTAFDLVKNMSSPLLTVDLCTRIFLPLWLAWMILMYRFPGIAMWVPGAWQGAVPAIR